MVRSQAGITYNQRSVRCRLLCRWRFAGRSLVAPRALVRPARTLPEVMSFDVLAPHYRWMEFILAGEKLHRCRTAFLDKVPDAKNILLLGEGHGRCLVECRRRFPCAKITCVDASESMLVQARRRLARHNLESANVEFIHANVLDWPPTEERHDLIVTHFFLDCFRPDQLEQIIFNIAAAATPGA